MPLLPVLPDVALLREAALLLDEFGHANSIRCALLRRREACEWRKEARGGGAFRRDRNFAESSDARSIHDASTNIAATVDAKISAAFPTP